MATIPAVKKDVGPSGDGSTILVTWSTVTEADECAPVSMPAHADKSILAFGTWDGANVAVHGSNDGTNYAPLADPGGTVIDITQDGAKQVVENTVWVKPVVTTGGATQDLDISMLFRLNNPLRQ